MLFELLTFTDAFATLEPLEILVQIGHMGVSINGGTPKWMVYKGTPYQNG